MQSPKFPLKLKDIFEVINSGRLKSRWREKVRDEMRRQVIPDSVEHLDFHIRIDALCKALADDVCAARYIPESPTRFLAEKSKGLCRQLVIPSVRDALVLQTISDAVWVELQEKAPSKNAYYMPSDQAFAKGNLEQDTGYSGGRTWLDFQKAILGFSNHCEYVVVTDIANYYDFISYEHLRNILAGLGTTKEHALDLLIYVLSHMLWQPDYMPRVPVGLPQMNLDAPRLLAHCFLFEIDDLLSNHLKVDYARYMDDIDIGVQTFAEAKQVLRDLDLSMQTRQVRLNSGKTSILTADQARKHFRARENSLLDQLELRVENKLAHSLSIDIERTRISKAISCGLRKGAFSGGNGSKILKRLINFARIYSAEINEPEFKQLLAEWPSVRQSVLIWWQHSSYRPAHLSIIADYLSSPEVIDDATPINAAVVLVNARLQNDLHTRDCISRLCSNLSEGRIWTLYAKLWILSKYGSNVELFQCIERTFSVWSTHQQLSRLVAGLVGRLRFTKHYTIFQGLESVSA